MGDILEEICSAKREYVSAKKHDVSVSSLEEQISLRGEPRGFYKQLLSKTNSQKPALIAEIKKASPSHGLIREDFSPSLHAASYEKGGATCLSILTDMPYFQGNDEFIGQAKSACSLPILRKDFILDTYQVAEARAIGADAILLIVAALDVSEMIEIENAAQHYSLDVLIEVHNMPELEIALKHLKSPLIGINNRNLKTLAIDTNTAVELKKSIPSEKLVVGESGINSNEQIQNYMHNGIYCFLVGESLMRQPDIAKATSNLLGE